ncbi:MAG: NAD(P)/FAD-dependent oxidoreductase [Candidatus Hydrogenedentota bacterium]
MRKKKAIIIGAGAAGLTAAYELIHKTDFLPVIYEMGSNVGGLCKTINYKGNRLDIGGHRFYTKSNTILQWWFNILPLQSKPARDDIVLGRKLPLSIKPEGRDPEKTDKVMLIRNRISRIFFMNKFFDYPLSLNTIFNLGILRILKILLSYICIRLFPIKEEKTIEDFFINRFGKELYTIFFKDYTEKVWGLSASEIFSQWGVHRVKSLSLLKAILDTLMSQCRKSFLATVGADFEHPSHTETTLIKYFYYPKLGPGQLWEEVAKIVEEKGGIIYRNKKAVKINCKNNNIIAIEFKDTITGETQSESGDYFFSSMPVKELVKCMENEVPIEVHNIANNLRYRDFITVGLLVKKLKIKNKTKIKTINNIIPDSWIYVQQKNIKLARIQIYNNWSPYMINDPDTVWLGLEYFCNEGDELWNKPDNDIINLAIDELFSIGMIDKEDYIDSTVLRIYKAYPIYCGSYNRFHIIKDYFNTFENLFLIGRNGMHHYDSHDHAMLTAITAVDNIINNIKTKDNIWKIII